MATSLSLGDVLFADLEVPERIPFGGDQSLVVHKLVGGARQIDAMGRDDLPPEWSGIFLGADALSRAKYLDAQRIAGASLPLVWSEFFYDVVIRRFEANFEREWMIPYRIVCEIVKDHSQPQTSLTGPSINDLISSDLSSANLLTDQIGDGTLSGLMGAVNSAISTVSSFASATASTINSVLQPINAVQQQVSTLIASAANTMTNVTTLGGILPNNPISQSVSSLAAQVTAYQNSPLLYNLQSVMGRMSTNLGSITGAAQQVTVAGGNLMQVAAKVYGKVEAWTGIAKANGLNDPTVQGVQTLNIPVTPDNSGGVLTG
ncbi:hypothetical protein WK91_18290 [Burkholderia cepacia]|uniref:hypothetical protein n=1 Tax=Burkholderia cepacia TaxID=292 RepID=UPI0007590A9A|nr:hypothetical protein [Burkholderia cepacia]KVW15387.1 hypothetical protein WK91_18290 [Burkholderia cepacia]